MSFVDRGVVFRWIHFYISRLDDTDYRALRDYKTDLLEILCLHEHHVPLNLPVLINAAAQIQRLNYSGGVVDTQMQTTNGTGLSGGYCSLRSRSTVVVNIRGTVVYYLGVRTFISRGAAVSDLGVL